MSIPRCGERTCTLPAHRRAGDVLAHSRTGDPDTITTRTWMVAPAAQPAPPVLNRATLILTGLATFGFVVLAAVAIVR